MDATASNYRRERGLTIVRAKRNAFRHVAGETFFVPSQTNHGGGYLVDAASGRCSCPDHEKTGGACKHRFALEFFRHETSMPDGTLTVTESIRISYPQSPSWTTAQIMELETMQFLSRSLCNGIATPRRKGRGGTRRLLVGDVVNALISRTYRGLSGRRSMSDLRNSARQGFLTKVPQFNTLYKYLADPSITPILESLVGQTARPLAALDTTVAMDSTGFSTLTFAPTNWYEHKHHGDDRVHDWVKMHAAVAINSNAITDAIVSTEGDARVFERLLARTIANGFTVREACADKAYLSHKNMAAAENVGAKLWVPFKSNSRSDTGDDLWDSLYHLFSLNRAVFNAHYLRRENVESTFSGLKRVFGGALRSRVIEAQVNEVYLKAICWNISQLIHAIYELKIEPRFWRPETQAVGA